MKKRLCRIHVSQPAIRQNIKDKKAGKRGYAPAITVKRGKENVYGHEILIKDNRGVVIAKVIQPEDKHLSCGARIWIESTPDTGVIEIREFREHDVLITELLR